MDPYRVVLLASPAELERSPYLAQIQRPVTRQEHARVVESERRSGLNRFAP